MGIINVLDIKVANLIAAGEVVERPASAVKELCENSIDAGADKITVEIVNGGVSMLRVTDNGCGMSAEDTVVSVKRHATSKIRTAADLSEISTLGFRGEALAAISSVCEFRIMTKKHDAEVGTLLVSKYGSAPEISEVGCPDGTTIVCEKLFATTPARLKFLKSDVSEAAAVQGIVERAAVSHPEISFKFISNGVVKFSTAGDGKLYNAIYSVYGRAFASSLAEISSKSESISVGGYVSSPAFTRGNRGMQLFYVNERPVRSKLLTAALEQAYDTYIPSGKYPSCVLNINIHSAYVDVNIHPSKLEVKFSDERSVFSAVYYSVRSVLENDIKRPSLSSEKKEINDNFQKAKITAAFAPVIERGEEKASQMSITEVIPKEHRADNKNDSVVVISSEKIVKTDEKLREQNFNRPPVTTYIPETKQSLLENTYKYQNISIERDEPPTKTVLRANTSFPLNENRVLELVSDKNEKPKHNNDESTDAKIPSKIANDIPEYKIIGELFESYVLIELGEKVIIIDKHAAHERINFEILRASMRDLVPHVQLLLAPIEIFLSSHEQSFCDEYKDELGKVGFVFERANGNVRISGIPMGYDVGDGEELFKTILGSLIDEGIPIEIKKTAIFEKSLYQTSCKMSIKAGRHYSIEHIKWICDNLLRYDCIKFCPHGRAVAFEMTKRELDARFGRIN